jgi:hypothetical protein
MYNPGITGMGYHPLTVLSITLPTGLRWYQGIEWGSVQQSRVLQPTDQADVQNTRTALPPIGSRRPVALLPVDKKNIQSDIWQHMF